MIEPRLMTVAEASEFLRINRFTLYRMAGRRKIPCLRIGRKLLFDRPRLERWIQARTIGERHGVRGVHATD